MADVDISYKGNVIASLDDTGTTTLETAGMYCEDDITVAYTKSGGGGSAETANVSLVYSGVDYAYYTDANMTVQTLDLYGSHDIEDVPMVVGTLMVTVRTGMQPPAPFPLSYSNLEQVATYTVGSKGQAVIYKVISST